ncbi:MAG: membrane protease subunit HflC, partial [Candidatus Omnitrophota bacterium]
HFKTPFIQTANFFEKRILQWDGDAKQIQTLEKRYIWVDATARWRIVDALKFMRTVRTEKNAQGRLDLIINSATRDVIAKNKLVESVRNTNRLVDVGVPLGSDAALTFSQSELEKITKGRDQLSREVLNTSSTEILRYGIELVDVRIKRINYIEDVQRKVYERMISERRQAAEQFRSEGQGKKAEIQGQMSKELQQIEAGAYRAAQELKGVADAKAIAIYANAYNKDPDFYTFTKTLESYRKTMKEGTTLIMSTDNAYYRQLNGIGVKTGQ